jgi:hypothetical protein
VWDSRRVSRPVINARGSVSSGSPVGTSILRCTACTLHCIRSGTLLLHSRIGSSLCRSTCRWTHGPLPGMILPVQSGIVCSLDTGVRPQNRQHRVATTSKGGERTGVSHRAVCSTRRRRSQSTTFGSVHRRPDAPFAATNRRRYAEAGLWISPNPGARATGEAPNPDEASQRRWRMRFAGRPWPAGRSVSRVATKCGPSTT